MKNFYTNIFTEILSNKKLNLFLISLLFIGGGTLSAQSFSLDMTGQERIFPLSSKTIVTYAGNGGNAVGSVHRHSNAVTVSGRVLNVFVKTLKPNDFSDNSRFF